MGVSDCTHLHRRSRCLFSVSGYIEGTGSPAVYRCATPTDTSSPSIFVGVPKIAQSKVNDAKLEVQGVNVLNTKPDSIKLEINSTITTDGSISAKIDPFDGVMYLEDLPDHTPFLNISFPATNGDKHQQVNISQEIQIQNPDAFNTFNIWFAANKTLNVTIEGRTKVKPSGLSTKSSVTFKKTITMNGLNLFDGLSVDNAKINMAAKKGQPNFTGLSDIPNASYFTLDIVSRLYLGTRRSSVFSHTGLYPC